MNIKKLLRKKENIGNYKIDSLDFWSGKETMQEKPSKTKSPDFSEIVKEDKIRQII